MTVYIAFGSRPVGMMIIQTLIELANSYDLLGHSRKLEEALVIIATHRPDIVILEDYLLDGQAIEMVELIAGGRWTQTVVMVSAGATPLRPEDLSAKGIDHWFRLPIGQVHLRSTLETIAAMKRTSGADRTDTLMQSELT